MGLPLVIWEIFADAKVEINCHEHVVVILIVFVEHHLDVLVKLLQLHTAKALGDVEPSLLPSATFIVGGDGPVAGEQLGRGEREKDKNDYQSKIHLYFFEQILRMKYSLTHLKIYPHPQAIDKFFLSQIQSHKIPSCLLQSKHINRKLLSQEMSEQNNQRHYQHMYSRILNKQAKGIQELQQYLHKIIDEFVGDSISESKKQHHFLEINQIINFFIQHITANHNETHINLLMVTLESIAYLIEQHKLIHPRFNDIAITILAYFSDANEKVRITAIGSIYNLLNTHSHRGLELFMKTFQALSLNVSDQSGQVRQAAAFLNQTLKTIINDTAIDQKGFNIKGFIQTLAQKFQTDQIILKEFLLDWIMAIEQIPQFQLSFYLPNFFKEAVQLLCPWNSKNLRTKSQECLKKFLHVFRQNLALGNSISLKIDFDNAKMLIEMTLLMIKQNISSESTYQSLEWLQIFTRYFTLELKLRKESFLELFYSAFLKEILQVIINSLSSDSQKIRRIAQIINDSLLATFPIMRKQQKKMNETSLLLQKFLHQNKIPARVGETIIKWIKLLLQQNSEQILVEINSLINCVVEKLCDRNATKQLFLLLQGSLFVQEYLDLLIETLLNYLCQNQSISPEPIIIQLLSFNKSEAIFLVICKRVRSFQNYKFQYRLLEHLMIILVTERSLEFLRTKLQNGYSNELLFELFQCFCKNESSVIILGFLSKKYHLITKFIVFLAEEERLTRKKFKSLVKMSNLIEHSNLNHLRTDLKKSPLAMKSYLAFLMILPYGKYQSVLLQRLQPQIRMQERALSPEEQKMSLVLIQQYKRIGGEQWQQQTLE